MKYVMIRKLFDIYMQSEKYAKSSIVEKAVNSTRMDLERMLGL